MPKSNAMQPIVKFEGLFDHLLSQDGRYKIIAVYPHDEHTQEAIEAALEKGFADFVLVGHKAELDALPLAGKYPGRVATVDAADGDEAARIGVEMIGAGEGDVLMKGKLNTDNLLRAVLNKEWGILPKGNVLSHVTVAEIPGRPRLLLYSDVAVIPYPTLAQREAIVGYLARVARALGIERPRVALTHFTEKVNPKFPVSTDYVSLKEMAAAGRWGEIVVDGPMDIKTAVNAEAAAIKGIVSPIEGKADALMMADIEAGNILYKTLTEFAGATNAGVIVGAKVPIVLPSRGDSSEGKLASLALACLMNA